jgi:hypothetical protein
MSFKFLLFRLLLIVVVFAMALWFSAPFGLWGILRAVVVAVPLSGIVLLARECDVIPVIRLVVFCGLGTFVGEMFCPRIRPPYEPGDEIVHMIVGAFIGWLVGLFLGLRYGEVADTEQSGIRSTDRGTRKRRWMWSVGAPLMAFLAGPVCAFLVWMVQVYVFKTASPTKSLEALRDAISLGVFFGFLAGVVVAMQVLLASARGHKGGRTLHGPPQREEESRERG